MRRKGLTLIELLVAMAVSALVLTIAAQLFVAAERAWVRSNRRATTLQNALLVVSRLREEVRDANPDATVYLPTESTDTDSNGNPLKNDAVLLVSWRVWDGTDLQWDPTGQVLWQSMIAIYQDPDTHRVLLRERLLPSASVDPPAVGVADFAAQPGDVTHVLAFNVRGLSLQPGGSNVVGFKVTSVIEDQTCVLDGSAMATVPSSAQPSPSPTP